MGEAVLVFNTGICQVCHTLKTKFVAKTAFCFIFRRKTHLQQGCLPRPVEKNRLACPVKSKPCPAVAEIDKTHRAQRLKNGWKKTMEEKFTGASKLYSAHSHLWSLFLCRAAVSAIFTDQPHDQYLRLWRVKWPGSPCHWCSHGAQIWWIPICDVSTSTRTSVMCVVGWDQPNVTNCSITCHCCLRDAQIAIF